MDKIITGISAIVAVLTFIFKVWSDFKNAKIKLKEELMEKRTREYQRFLITLSNFLGNMDSPERRGEFLQLCYTMVLVCDKELKGNVEKLLDYTLKYSRGEWDDEQFKTNVGSDTMRKRPGLLVSIIEKMRYDLTGQSDSLHLNWLEAIEFLIGQAETRSKEAVEDEGESETEDIPEETRESLEVKSLQQDRPVEREREKSKESQIEEEDEEEQESESEPDYYWVNTCETHIPGTWENMLKEGIACTYGPQEYGDKLKRIREGDRILLYLSGSGIIAAGTVEKAFSGMASSSPKTVQDDNEYSIDVDWDMKGAPDACVSPREIKETGHNVFVPTIMRLDPETGYEIEKKLGVKVWGHGVSLIYAPRITSNTFLHFSWKGQSCALRDYSQSSTEMPEPNRDYETSEMRGYIEQEFTIPKRPAISQVEEWHRIICKYNQDHLKAKTS